MYSLPSNQIELWAALESDRMSHPVMREFYKERNVVMEERRMRTDSQPTGRLVEQFLGTAFMANPYHRPTIGYASDLHSFSATDAAEFFQHYYVPSNMVIGAGRRPRSRRRSCRSSRSTSASCRRLPKPAEPYTIEPPQNSVRAGHAAGSVAAVLSRGLSPAQLSRSGRCGLRRHLRHSVQRTHLAALSLAGARPADRGLRRRLLRIARAASTPTCSRFMQCRSRPYQRRIARSDSRTDRQAEDARRHRRRAADVQDAHQGRPDPRPRQQ